MVTTISVVIADDHQIFMEGVSSLFDDIDHINLVGKFSNGNDLLAALADQCVDVALVDLSMPGPRSEELLDQLTQLCPTIRPIAVTMHCDAFLASRLIEHGLKGFLVKDSAFDDLIVAIEAAMEDNIYISPALQNLIPLIAKDDHRSSLTDREESVLQEVALGKANKQIAKELNISERTVRFHISNCCHKLKASNRSEAVMLARSRHLIVG